MRIIITETQLIKMIENVADETLPNEFILNPKDVPNKLYHATFERNLESMLEYGIGANSNTQEKMMGNYAESIYNNDGVFLASDYYDAIEYVANDERRKSDRIAVILVPKKALDLSNLQYDTNNESLMDYLESGRTDALDKSQFTFFYKGIIDPMKTKLITK